MGVVCRLGCVGAGLMGHAAAKTVLENSGRNLTVIIRRNRWPIQNPVRRGASEGDALAASVAAWTASDHRQGSGPSLRDGGGSHSRSVPRRP